jgi:hypothetical protein
LTFVDVITPLILIITNHVDVIAPLILIIINHVDGIAPLILIIINHVDGIAPLILIISCSAWRCSGFLMSHIYKNLHFTYCCLLV